MLEFLVFLVLASLIRRAFQAMMPKSPPTPQQEAIRRILEASSKPTAPTLRDLITGESRPFREVRVVELLRPKDPHLN